MNQSTTNTTHLMTAAEGALPPLIAALCQPDAYPHPIQAVEVVQTPISYVLLTGAWAYKVKKPLDLAFLDYTTLEARRHFCQEELRLNRRLCPDIYRDVVAITWQDGRARIGGEGPVVEHAVQMRQLPTDRMLPQLLAANAVTAADVEAVARTLATFHARAETGPEVAVFGTPEQAAANAAENFEQTTPYIGQTITAERHAALQAASAHFLQRHGGLMRDRAARGRVRDGHGDLRAANICLTDPVAIFDCIEFSPRLRCADVAAEVAFLAMDLDYYGQPALARHFIDAYIAASGDSELVQVLPFYLAYRAIVRGKCESLSLADPGFGPAERAAAIAAAERYFALAERYLRPAGRPRLVLFCGLMATGKSTLARALGAHLGWPVISSDVTRKQLIGRPLTAHAEEAYGAGAYEAEITRRTYDALLDAAARELAAGRSVILDASFQRAAERGRARTLAAAEGADLLLIEVHCSEAVIRERLRQRAAAGTDPSDGREELYDRQHAAFEVPTEFPAWQHVLIDGQQPAEAALQAMLRGLEVTASHPARAY